MIVVAIKNITILMILSTMVFCLSLLTQRYGAFIADSWGDRDIVQWRMRNLMSEGSGPIMNQGIPVVSSHGLRQTIGSSRP